MRGISTAQKTYVLFKLAEAYLAPNGGRKPCQLSSCSPGLGPEAQAAAFRLAELLMGDAGRREDAVKALEEVALTLPPSEAWDNKVLPLSEARGLFETVAKNLWAANAFDLSVRAARAFGKIAEDGRDHELAAEALQSWGEILIESVRMANAEDRPRLADEGTRRLREAANEWRLAAAARKKSVDKGDALCKAADLFLKAGDLQEALKTLDELGLKVPDYPSDRLPKIWFKKGEIYMALGNREQAKLCYENVVQITEQHPTVTLVRCRLRLAEIALKNNDTKGLARIIADLESDLVNPDLIGKDPPLQESVLFFIADAFFQQEEYRKAEVRLLSLFQKFPDSPRALTLQFMLGQCYWNIAKAEAAKCKEADKRKNDPLTPDDRRVEAESQYEASYKLYMDWLKKATEQFQIVESILLKKSEDKKQLAPDEAELIRRVSFFAADCAFLFCQIRRSHRPLRRHFSALSGHSGPTGSVKSMWRIHQNYKQDPKKAVETCVQMRTIFVHQMDDSEFDGSSEIRKREYWQKWFDTICAGEELKLPEAQGFAEPRPWACFQN